MRNILTNYDRPPIPTTRFDWCAWYEGEEEGYTGRGPTKESAIAELLGHEGATCTEVAEELIGRGYTDSQVAKVMNTQRYEVA